MNYIPQSRATDKRFYGLYSGIVVDVNDTEGQGRVKLSLRWFNQEMITDWCRVCHLYAGPGFGSSFVPELQTEVAVCFMHGDFRWPVIMGGFYSKVDLPMTQRSNSLDEKIIKTKAGHQIILDDSSGSEKVVIIDSTNTQRIELKEGNVTISCKGKLSLQADDIEITASQSMNIHADVAMKISSDQIDLN